MAATKTEPPRTNERVPPQDLDAEMAAIGSMMMSADAIDEVAQVISDSAAFYVPAHQKLFEVLCDLREAGKAIDIIIVCDELRRRELLEYVGGQDYMIQLAESFSEWSNATYYARLVWEAYQKRSIIRIASQLVEQAFSPMANAVDLVAEYAPQLDGASTKINSEPRTLAEIADDLPQWWERTRSDSILTGITALDDSLGGFERPSFVIVGARPRVGKSSFLLHLAKQAGAAGIPVLFFILEAGEKRTAQRFASNLANMTTGFLRRNASPEDRRFAVDVVRGSPGASNIYLSEKHTTLQDILSLSRLYIRRRGVRMVLVDYLQIVQYVGKTQTRDLEIGKISRGLARLALDNDVQVTAAAQLLRPDRNKKTEGPPKLSDLRESGNMEQDADVVILLHRLISDRYSERMIKTVDLDVIVAKNKDGPTPAFTLRFNQPTFSFEDDAAVAEDPVPEGEIAPIPQAAEDLPF